MYKKAFNSVHRWIRSTTPHDRKWLSFYATGTFVSICEIVTLLIILKFLKISLEPMSLILLTIGMMAFHWIFMESNSQKK